MVTQSVQIRSGHTHGVCVDSGRPRKLEHKEQVNEQENIYIYNRHGAPWNVLDKLSL